MNTPVPGSENINDILNATAAKITDSTNSQEQVKLLTEGLVKTKEEEESDNKWNAVSITDFLGKEELKNLQESLQEIRNVIQKIKDTIEGARTAIELIKQLENLLEDTIGAVLNKVIEILENLINNVASTGVYFLDMIEPYQKIQTSSDGSFSHLKVESAYKKKLIDYINNSMPTEEGINFSDSILKDSKYVNGVSGVTIEENIKQQKESFNLWMLNNIGYEATTYDEWIDKLANAFIDENDKPSLNPSYIDKEALLKFKNLFGSEISKMDEATYSYYNRVQDRYRAGAPQWGKGSSSVTAIIAVNLSNFEEILKSGNELLNNDLGLYKYILHIQSFLGRNNNKGDSATAIKQQVKTAEVAKKNVAQKKVKQKKVQKEKVSGGRVKMPDGPYYEGPNSVNLRSKEDWFSNFFNLEQEQQTLGDKISNGIGSISNGISSVGTTKIPADEYGNQYKTAGFLKKVGNRIYDGAVSIGDGISDGFGSIVNGLESVSNKIYVGRINAGMNFRKSIGNAGEKIWKFGEDTLLGIGEYTQDAGEAIANAAKTIADYGKPKGDAIRGYIDESLDSISAKIEELKIAEYNKKYSRITPPAQAPNFKGITIEKMAPSFWREVRVSLSAFKSLATRSTDSWSDSLEELLDSFDGRINKIKKIINNIDNLITAIETLQNLSVSILIVNSKGGVYDIYDKLKSATGFPGQEENGTSIILGIALAAGMPSSDLADSSINFGEFIKDLQVTIDSNEDFVDAFDTPRDGGEAMLRKFLSFFKKK
jgi:hypothetical protein